MEAASSVTDARTVVIVERLLNYGYAIQSRMMGDQFAITITDGEAHGTGYGDTFPIALYGALATLRNLPQVALSVGTWR